jgi:hypothetical protein
MRITSLFSLFFFLLFGHRCLAFQPGGPPQLLPDADHFRLTLHEGSDHELAVGKSCGGKAGATLACRPLTLTLENLSKRTIHLTYLKCRGPRLQFEIPWPAAGADKWGTVSQPREIQCTEKMPVDIRLAPGEQTVYSTRMISDLLQTGGFLVGKQVLRAHWVLWGCSEDGAGDNCLHVSKTDRSFRDINWQIPVEVVSNEITANSPGIAGLGEMKFALDFTEQHNVPAVMAARAGECVAAAADSMACKVFHFRLRNLTGQTLLIYRTYCNLRLMQPIQAQVLDKEDHWSELEQQQDFLDCNASGLFSDTLLPGGSLEGDFRVGRIRGRENRDTLKAAGDYRLRLFFYPDVCFASPDGAFCIGPLIRNRPAVGSNELQVHASAAETKTSPI